MFLRKRKKPPIEVNCKKRVVRIFDSIFPCTVDEYGTCVVTSKWAIDSLGALTFSDIPPNLIFRCKGSMRIPYGEDFTLEVKLTSQTASFEISYRSAEDSLHTPEEYKSALEIVLRERGYSISDVSVRSLLGDSQVINAKIDVAPSSVITTVVRDIVAAIKEVNQNLLENEEDARQTFWRILSRCKGIDGAMIASYARFGGIFRWIIGALTESDIMYLILSIQHKLVKRYAERVNITSVIDFKVVIPKLKALGIHYADEKYSLKPCGYIITYILQDVLEKMQADKERKHRGLACEKEALLLKYFWYRALDIVWREFYSLAVKESPRIRLKSKEFRAHVDRILSRITFVKLGILMSINLKLNFPHEIFAEEISEMMKDGLISKNLRLRRYGVWIVRLVSNLTLRLLSEPGKRRLRRGAEDILAKAWNWARDDYDK